MHEVFRDIDSAKVGMINSILKESGFQTLLKNWESSNITSIPIPSLYPTIYISDKRQAEEARKLVKEFFEAKIKESEDWKCQKCEEIVDGFLSECWKCQEPRDDKTIE